MAALLGLLDVTGIAFDVSALQSARLSLQVRCHVPARDTRGSVRIHTWLLCLLLPASFSGPFAVCTCSLCRSKSSSQADPIGGSYFIAGTRIYLWSVCVFSRRRKAPFDFSFSPSLPRLCCLCGGEQRAMRLLEKESERVVGDRKDLLTSPQQLSKFLFEELKLPVPGAASSSSATSGGKHVKKPASASSSTGKTPVVSVSTSDEVLQVRGLLVQRGRFFSGRPC